MKTPAQDSLAWGRLRVGTTYSPGQVKLSGPGLQIGWDVQNATGQSGGTTTRTFEPIKKFEAEFYLVDEADAEGKTDFDRWEAFEKILQASVAKRTKTVALSVYHPDLARVKITAATIESIGLMVLDGKGGATIKVAFLEYKPPKKILYPQTKTEGDRQIEARTKEIEKIQKEWKTL